MSKLRASISFKHKVDEVKIIQQQKLKENIAEPIVPIIINDQNKDLENPINLEIQQEDSINLETQKENPNLSENDSDDDDDESQVLSNWNTLINTWEQLLLQEENNDETNLDDDFDSDITISEILLNQTHPALDNEAKWNIESIFINNLDAPFFVNENTLD